MLGRASLGSIDRYLIVTVLIALIFCLFGIQWGRVEDWHPDEMVFSRVPFDDFSIRPVDYLKPSFHTYFSLIVRIPVKVAVTLFHLPQPLADSIDLIAARLLTVLLFIGSIVLVYLISKRSFGLFPARFLALILSTSAGFIAFSHFLTVDIPVTFWMLLALYFSLNLLNERKTLNYILAGFFTGIATATKYNGLGIGISIVVAHLLSMDHLSWKNIHDWKNAIFNRNIFISLLMILVGFLLGNPYILVDVRRFVSDFLYSYLVTPVYSGVTTGHNYSGFFLHIGELIGFPALLLFSIGFLFSVYVLVFRKQIVDQTKVLWVLLSAFLLYYFMFGSFPRLETRFVLPIVPVFLLISGPLIRKISQNKPIMLVLLIGLVSYNLFCSYYVGKLFLTDPRMEAQEWVRDHIPTGSSIESSPYVPKWNNFDGVKLQDIRMPSVSGRNRLFQESLRSNSWLIAALTYREVESQNDINWFTDEQLLIRKPEYLAIDSLYYDRFQGNKYYPSIEKFFVDLLAEKASYHIIFQKETKEVPIWMYPHKIDVLGNKLTILEIDH